MFYNEVVLLQPAEKSFLLPPLKNKVLQHTKDRCKVRPNHLDSKITRADVPQIFCCRVIAEELCLSEVISWST
jgi:hypothetical protein